MERQVYFNRSIEYFDGVMGYQADGAPLVSATEMEIIIPKATRYVRVGYRLLYPVDLAALSYLAEYDGRDDLFTDCTPSLLIDLDEVISFTHGLCRKYLFGHRPIFALSQNENKVGLSQNETVERSRPSGGIPNGLSQKETAIGSAPSRGIQKRDHEAAPAGTVAGDIENGKVKGDSDSKAP